MPISKEKLKALLKETVEQLKALSPEELVEVAKNLSKPEPLPFVSNAEAAAAQRINYFGYNESTRSYVIGVFAGEGWDIGARYFVKDDFQPEHGCKPETESSGGYLEYLLISHSRSEAVPVSHSDVEVRITDTKYIDALLAAKSGAACLPEDFMEQLKAMKRRMQSAQFQVGNAASLELLRKSAHLSALFQPLGSRQEQITEGQRASLTK